jgi:hypothetical protein
MMKPIRRLTFAALAVAALMLSTAAVRANQNPSTIDATSVNVTVKYTGAGTVDATHRIWVWIFDTPNIGPDAMPIGEQSISTNGGTATFSTTTKQVYVAMAFDEQGGFMGQAPPPSGAPVAMYGMTGPDGQPQPVAPGGKGAVTVTFDDTMRMP